MTKQLTKAEEQVMMVLWKLGKGFLKDIIDATPEPKPHSNTIATILKILIEKGYVDYQTQGRNNFYKPKIAKSDYAKKSINQLVKSYFEGSAAKLVSQFVSDNKLNQQELEELLKQIESSKKQQP
ncbi:MAG TPA: BlaI/MecI/CopY family transcriptional regulator [Puia sp.]|nr:BlaI/MecI/CopY family transcriptional regulator [Puia sp.]